MSSASSLRNVARRLAALVTEAEMYLNWYERRVAQGKFQKAEANWNAYRELMDGPIAKEGGLTALKATVTRLRARANEIDRQNEDRSAHARFEDLVGRRLAA